MHIGQIGEFETLVQRVEHMKVMGETCPCAVSDRCADSEFDAIPTGQKLDTGNMVKGPVFFASNPDFGDGVNGKGLPMVIEKEVSN
jgi:hypothetical protein